MNDSSVAHELDLWLRQTLSDADSSELEAHPAFPSDETASLYLSSVEDRPEAEVIDLLWRMISACTSQADRQMSIAILDKVESLGEIGAKITSGGSLRRIRWRERTGIGEAWEGMTWALEMLPHRPGAVVDALNLYLRSQHGLPDRRIHAFSDAVDIVRVRWIGNPKTASERLDALKGLHSRKFEALIAALWRAMGYEDVTLTQAVADGGYDVLAERERQGFREKVMIECKRYTTKNVPVEVVRGLNGLAGPRLAYSRLVIVTTAGFTRSAKAEAAQNQRTQLIDGNDLVPLLNQYLGHDWPARLERIVRYELGLTPER